MNTIEIALAENSEKGKACGRVSEVDFLFEGEIIARLEVSQLFNDQPCFTNPLGNISMYGYVVKTDSRHAWAGNMMWNQYSAGVNYALGFINMLMFSGMWNITEGYTEIFHKWGRKQEITSVDLGIEGEPIAPKIINTRANILEKNPQATFEFQGPVPGEDDPNQMKLL